jgi:Cellulose biosynthesis protein BcsS
VFAADISVKAPAESAEPIDYVNMYFGTDATTNGGLVGYGGLRYAPGGIDNSGLRVAVFGLYGKYRYSTEEDGSTSTFKGRFASVDVLTGYARVFENGEITLAIGANYQDQRVSPPDPNNSVQGEKLGFKVQGDFYVNPTEQTLVTGLASYSTAFHTYYSNVKFGYDVFGRGFFIGPEFVALGNQRTDQQRVGLHITGIELANKVSLSLSGGWLHERNERDGAYVTSTINFAF